MVLIISQNEYEPTTEMVIDWLHYYNVPWKRLNGSEFLDNIHIQLNGLWGYHNNILGNVDTVFSVTWLRRWLSYGNVKQIIFQDAALRDVSDYYMREIKYLRHYFMHRIGLQSNKTINCDFSCYPENKLEILEKAKDVGLDIPNTIVTSRKSRVIEFMKERGRIIIKGISGSHTISFRENIYSSYTSEISIEDMGVFNEIFCPTLFQEMLDKDFEVRIFYLDNKFYSMAIFSQSDPQTMIDFRKYNKKKMNRTIPFKLPLEVERKIQNLMNILKLDTCSIDMIRTKDKRWVFLEVNPEGQFGMVSFPCNYYLEREFAIFLSKQNQSNK